MEKYNKISSKIYKHLVHQKVQQKVQKKCIKKCTIFMFHFLESDLYLKSGISLLVALILDRGHKLYYSLVKRKQNTKKKQSFHKFY